MKHHLYTLIIFLLFGYSLSAQFQIGFEGGAGLNAQTGLHLALPVEWEFSSLLSLHTGPVLVLRGQDELLEKLSSDLDYRHVEMNYLSLPLLLKLHWHFSDFSTFTSFGPSVAYSTSMGVNYLHRGELYREKLISEDLEVSNWEYGLEWEVGFRTEIRGGKKIYAAFRYHLGLRDIDQVKDNKIYHEGGTVILGVLLPIKKARSLKAENH